MSLSIFAVLLALGGIVPMRGEPNVNDIGFAINRYERDPHIAATIYIEKALPIDAKFIHIIDGSVQNEGISALRTGLEELRIYRRPLENQFSVLPWSQRSVRKVIIKIVGNNFIEIYRPFWKAGTYVKPNIQGIGFPEIFDFYANFQRILFEITHLYDDYNYSGAKLFNRHFTRFNQGPFSSVRIGLSYGESVRSFGGSRYKATSTPRPFAHSNSVLNPHRIGSFASIFDSFAGEHDLPKQEARSDGGYYGAGARDYEHPKRPYRHGFLGSEIALLTLGSILGLGAGCYALGKVGKSRSIPVNLAWILAFGIGCAVGGPCLLLAVMIAV